MKYKIAFVLILLTAAVLRFAHLDTLPPSLYWDEVSQGYNSYSILTTGKDEHAESYPLARFQAFGDYKAPVYIYLDVIPMAIFGKTEFAVRFPSAFFGSLTVLVTYFLVTQMLFKDKNKKLFGITASLLLAISPWHIQLSRAAYEANIATFFTVSGIMIFFLAKNKNPWFYILSSICLVLGFYSFNAHRVFIPLLTLLLTGLFYKEIIKPKSYKKVIIAIFIGFILLIPFISFIKTPESKLRFREVNIFSDFKIVKESNDRMQHAGNTLFSKLIDNRRVLFAEEYLKHYFDFFSPKYLFFTGDENPRFSLQNNGILYIWELPLLLAGFYTLARRRDKISLFILGWFLLAPIGAATARETPHALRALTYIPTYQIIGGFGFVSLLTCLKSSKYKHLYYSSITASALIVISSVFLFLHNYFVHFPVTYAAQWQYGYKQALAEVEKIKDNYDEIIMTDKYGRPYIYVLFYTGISPSDYWKTGVIKKDKFGFYNVYKVGKYRFVESAKIRNVPVKKTLFVISADEKVGKMKIIKEINFPNGKNAFILAERIIDTKVIK